MLAGMGLLAMILITPAWLDWRELVWQRDAVRLQAESMAKQRESFSAFHDALVADDPLLIERLAYTHLRYKPTGKVLLGNGTGTLAMASHGPSVASEAVDVNLRGSAMIEQWLSTPHPSIGKEIPAYQPVNTRLTRLASGATRWVLIVVAFVCLLAGLWPDSEEEVTQPSHVAAGTHTMSFGEAVSQREQRLIPRLRHRLLATLRARP